MDITIFEARRVLNISTEIYAKLDIKTFFFFGFKNDTTIKLSTGHVTNFKNTYLYCIYLSQ